MITDMLNHIYIYIDRFIDGRKKQNIDYLLLTDVIIDSVFDYKAVILSDSKQFHIHQIVNTWGGGGAI